MTIIEARMALLPVVATDVSGVREVLGHERTGLRAPAGDDQDLAKAVLRLASEPELRQQRGTLGNQRAKWVICEEEMRARYQRCFEEMRHE